MMETTYWKTYLRALFTLSIVMIYALFIRECNSTIIAADVNRPLSIQAPTVSPAGPVRKQVKTYPVATTNDVNPKIIWFQLDNGSFRAEAEEARAAGFPGFAVAANQGSVNAPFPVRTSFIGVTDMAPYAPGVFKDSEDKQHPKASLTEYHLSNVRDEHFFLRRGFR